MNTNAKEDILNDILKSRCWRVCIVILNRHLQHLDVPSPLALKASPFFGRGLAPAPRPELAVHARIAYGAHVGWQPRAVQPKDCAVSPQHSRGRSRRCICVGCSLGLLQPKLSCSLGHLALDFNLFLTDATTGYLWLVGRRAILCCRVLATPFNYKVWDTLLPHKPVP